MEFSRYVNGQTVTQQELSSLSLVIPALTQAVRDAERRAERQDVISPYDETMLDVKPSGEIDG